LIRALLSMVTFVAATILGSVSALVAGLIDRTGDRVLVLARLWARVLLGVPGVRLEVKMGARLEPGRPYIFMPNHASMVDIWAVLVAIPVSFRFIAKKQLASIPLFGWAMAAGRFIFIDRQHAVAARRSMDEAARRIRAGQSVVIFPEGTRTRTGRLLPFKKGGFHLAIDSGAAIVPVAIRGSHAVMPPGSPLIRAGTVSIEVDEPIPTADLRADDREALIDRVRGRVAAMLGEPADAAAGAAAAASVNHSQ
jgi:1-acyl-sn-glycerol-3-phosphate acyltransferase